MTDDTDEPNPRNLALNRRIREQAIAAERDPVKRQALDSLIASQSETRAENDARLKNTPSHVLLSEIKMRAAIYFPDFVLLDEFEFCKGCVVSPGTSARVRLDDGNEYECVLVEFTRKMVLLKYTGVRPDDFEPSDEYDDSEWNPWDKIELIFGARK